MERSVIRVEVTTLKTRGSGMTSAQINGNADPGFRFAPSELQVITTLFIIAISIPARAADFYAGKNIDFLVGADAGGGYDIYARAVARHWGKYIPGHPTIVVRNMPGAG